MTTRFDSARALAQLAAGLVLGEPTPRLADRLFETLAPALELDTLVHYVHRPGDEQLTLAGWRGISAQQATDIARLPIGDAVCGLVAREACAHAVSDIPTTTDPRYGLLRGFGLTTYVCHPLLARAEVLGTLSFGSRRRDSFDADEVALLRTASDVLAAGLARARAEIVASDAVAAATSASEEQRRLADRVVELERSGGAELAETRHRLAEAESRVAQLQHALDSRVLVEQAKGVLAERHGLSLEQAFEQMRAHARHHRLKIHEVARRVIGGADPLARARGVPR